MVQTFRCGKRWSWTWVKTTEQKASPKRSRLRLALIGLLLVAITGPLVYHLLPGLFVMLLQVTLVPIEEARLMQSSKASMELLAAPLGSLSEIDALSEAGGLPGCMYNPVTLSGSRVLDEEQLTGALDSGGLMTRTPWEAFQAKRLGIALTRLRQAQPQRLVMALSSQYSEHLAATRRDAILYYLLTDTRLEGTPAFWERTRQDWQTLAECPNPIGRLLATHYAHRWSTNEAELLAQSQRALAEKESLFHITALDQISLWNRTHELNNPDAFVAALDAFIATDAAQVKDGTYHSIVSGALVPMELAERIRDRILNGS
jgi:hypothetical protein